MHADVGFEGKLRRWKSYEAQKKKHKGKFTHLGGSLVLDLCFAHVVALWLLQCQLLGGNSVSPRASFLGCIDVT
jgi:hypothetical protein